MDDATAREIALHDAHGQAELVRRGDIAPDAPVEAAIARIRTSRLNAISYVVPATARVEARIARGKGEMAGIPWLVKDSLDYPGMPGRSGNYARDPVPAMRSHDFVDTARAAGLCAVGKSAMPEFALSATTEGLVPGPVANPWSPGHSAGGSSGGAAAAVAAALVPFAHASDGGGSIRIPAACCGLIGYKPGRGFNMRARAPHIVEDMIVGDTLLARSARDTRWAARRFRPVGVAARPAPGRSLRIRRILASPAGTAPDPQVAAAIDTVAYALEALGHHVEDGTWPVATRATVPAFVAMWGYLAREAIASIADPDGAAVGDMVEPWTMGLARSAGAHGGAAAFFDGMAALPAAMAALFAQCDLILSPVTATPPPELGLLAPDRPFDALMAAMFDYVAYTPLQNLAGLPSMAIPAHLTPQGLPVGAMLTAPPGGDDWLLDLLAPLEEAGDWRNRLAPVAEAAA